MKNPNKISGFIGIVLIYFAGISSCSEDPGLAEKVNQTQHMDSLSLITSEQATHSPDSVIGDEVYCDLDFVLNYPGTACCVTGMIKASPGDTLTYEYHCNFCDSAELVFNWEVRSGSIRLIEGQNTATATFTFDENFTSGAIRGYAEGDYLDAENEIPGKTCSEQIDISKK